MGRWAAITRDRRWLVFLTAVNLGGFVYGLEWYRGQLACLPVWVWPVTADCPVSALLFGCVTAALAGGRGAAAVEGVAYVAALKYGLWTVLVLGQSWLAGAPLDADGINLLWTHLGLAGEAVLFGLVRRPRLRWVVLGGAWVGFNTFVDYTFRVYPTLPAQTPVALARAAAVALDLLTVGLFGLVGVARRGGATKCASGGW